MSYLIEFQQVRLGKLMMLALWLLLNAALGVLVWTYAAQASLLTCALVIVVTPLYVALVHEKDRDGHWLGIHCMREIIKDYERTDGSLAEVEDDGNPFRRTLRLEMLTIMSGFAATLFVLSIQFYFELGPERRPFLVLEMMAILFFLASLLNFLQIVLYDFRLTMRTDREGAYATLRRRVGAKLRMFHLVAWHSLVASMILAFYLIHPQLCVLMNCAYGVCLFLYYFLPCEESFIELCNAHRAREDHPARPTASAIGRDEALDPLIP